MKGLLVILVTILSLGSLELCDEQCPRHHKLCISVKGHPFFHWCLGFPPHPF